MAPAAKLVIYKALSDAGTGNDAWIIKALDHIAQINADAGQPIIHGVNLSLGGGFDPSVFGCGIRRYASNCVGSGIRAWLSSSLREMKGFVVLKAHTATSTPTWIFPSATPPISMKRLPSGR